MEVIRKTLSRCHHCAKEVDGAVVVSEGKAYLFRECPEHGPYQHLLSEHGEDYADMDRFYTEVHETSETLGRTMHTWVFATMDCQQKCPFCCTDCGDNDRQHFPWEELNWDDLQGILQTFKRGKISFAGGEPTLHPNVLDFFREADKRGVAAQLATNGLMLVSKEYCQKLKDSKVREVRLSVEAAEPEGAAQLGLSAYVETKLKAIDNLSELGIAVTLSPTICKGVNEEQIFKLLEYAKDKPIIQAFSMQGFSWTGCGTGLPKTMMISPDEMMDTIHRHYCTCDRHDVYALQKLAFAFLNVVGFKTCLKSEFMIFLRDGDKLRPITEYINLGRLDKMLNWWRGVIPRKRWARGVLLAPVLLGGMTWRIVPLIPMFAGLVWANMRKLDVHRYPSRLLVVALNTNCSNLNADHTVNAHCVSGCYFKRNGVVQLTTTSKELLDNQETKAQPGFLQRIRETARLSAAKKK